MLESHSAMRKAYISLLIFSLIFSGCSWFRMEGSSKVSSKRKNPDDLVVKLDEKKPIAEDSIADGNIIDALKLKRGGKIIVIPFSPGEGVEADDEFDRMTLRMIRSIADQLEAENSKFSFLTSEDVEKADFIIEGRVNEIKEPSMMKTLTLRSNRLKISVQGKMVDRETEKPVIVFNDTVEAKNKKDTLEDLGVIIGRHIGRLVAVGKTADK